MMSFCESPRARSRAASATSFSSENAPAGWKKPPTCGACALLLDFLPCLPAVLPAFLPVLSTACSLPRLEDEPDWCKPDEPPPCDFPPPLLPPEVGVGEGAIGEGEGECLMMSGSVGEGTI